MATKRVVVVGGGLAGLAATMKLAELGVAVDLISLDAGQAFAQRMCSRRYQ